MDVLAAYQEVGSYRGAAEICGTTHKTVRRIVQRHNGGGAAPPRRDRGHNYAASIRQNQGPTRQRVNRRRPGVISQRTPVRPSSRTCDRRSIALS